jgi:hypothetical protein
LVGSSPDPVSNASGSFFAPNASRVFELHQVDKDSRSFLDRCGTDRDGDLMPTKLPVMLADLSENSFVD